MFTCTCACMYAYTYTCVHVYIYVLYMCMYTCTVCCMYTHTQIHVCVCYVHTHIHVKFVTSAVNSQAITFPFHLIPIPLLFTTSCLVHTKLSIPHTHEQTYTQTYSQPRALNFQTPAHIPASPHLWVSCEKSSTHLCVMNIAVTRSCESWIHLVLLICYVHGLSWIGWTEPGPVHMTGLGHCMA